MQKITRSIVLLGFVVASMQLVAAPALSAPSISVPLPNNPFGGQFGPDDSRFTVLETLGGAYIRTGVKVEGWSGRCFDCRHAGDLGIETVLRVKANGNNNTATVMPTDVASYRATVSDVVAKWHPAVLVVENEPDSRRYWAGSVNEYKQLFTAACDAAHSHGVPCTSGGLSSTAVTSMVYQSYLDRGDRRGAKAYASDTSLSSAAYTKMIDPKNAEKIEEIADKAERYLQTHVDAGADLVNFHWYRSAEAFSESVEYLTSKTGLPAMNNEIGQYTSKGSETTSLMNAVLDAELRFAIWMSIDLLHERDKKEIVALHNPDATLRPSGDAFKATTASLDGSRPTS